MSDRKAATGAWIAERFPGVAFFTDATEMMDRGEVDAVVTTFLQYLHPGWPLRGCGEGCTCPWRSRWGSFTKQVKRMLDVAAAAPGVRLAAMFYQRANPLWTWIKGVLDSEEICEPRRASCLFPAPSSS